MDCFCLSTGLWWPIYGVFRDTQLSHTIGSNGLRTSVDAVYYDTFRQRLVDSVTIYQIVWVRLLECVSAYQIVNVQAARICGLWGRTLVSILSQ